MDIIKDTIQVYLYDYTWSGKDMIGFYITNSSVTECLNNFLSLNNLEMWI